MWGKWLLSSQLCSTLNHTVWSDCRSSPTGSCAKAYIWQAFKPQQQNMCWRKWFKILRKQPFIPERLFTWDNKLLPRRGAIHQETPPPGTHWLESASQPPRGWDDCLSSAVCQDGSAGWAHLHDGKQPSRAESLPILDKCPRYRQPPNSGDLPDFPHGSHVVDTRAHKGDKR